MNINVNIYGLDEAIRRLEAYRESLENKTKELCRRLAEYGLVLARTSYASAEYDGEKDIRVDVEETDNGYRIIASGGVVLIVEFGAGITYGGGHPMANQFGYGPGTHPNPHYRKIGGQVYANWESPDGWYVPKSKGGFKTYGNPPSKTMYNTSQDIKKEIARVAREVFSE